MSKLRVYMVGKELGIDNKALVALFQSIGATDVKNHMSAVAPEQVERVKRQLAKHGDEDQRAEERVSASSGSGSVVIRRGRRPEQERAPEPAPQDRPLARPTGGVVVRRGTAERGAPAQAAAEASKDERQLEPSSASPAVTESPASAQEPVESGAVHAEPSHTGRPSDEQIALDSHPSQRVPPTQPTGAQSLAEASASVADAPASSSSAPESHQGATRAEAPAPASAASAPVASTPLGADSAKAAPVPSEGPAATAGAAPLPNEVGAPTNEAAPAAEPSPPPRSEAAPSAGPGAAPRPAGAPAAAAPAAAASASTASPAGASLGGQSARPAPAAGPVRPAHAGPSAPAAARPQTATGAPPRRAPEAPASATRPSSPPKTGIDVWEGRPGVPMPQAPRGAMAPRRVQYDAKSPGGAGAAARRGPQMSGGGRPGARGPARRGMSAFGGRRPLGAPSTTQERSAHKKVVKIEGNITLQMMAAKLGIKAAELLMKLLGLGMTGVNINSTLDSDTAKIVAGEFGWTVEDVAVTEDEAIAAAQGIDQQPEDGERVPRPPVVTVMGHVDHGKTSLLDRIRKAQVASGEAGGITQHIGAYSVKAPQGRITFLDTPGHEAFTQMRARGAKITDIVVLVVAADDGVMPQTKEAINHAKDAGCPIVVAVNKIDKPEAQPDRVRRELSELGLMPEEWGGETLFCEVSAHTGDGIEALLDTILLQAEVLDLRANPNRHARGTVIEAKLDRGRGPVATILVSEGTLRKGDGILVGNSWGRVRAMLDDSGRNVAEAGPATPVAIIGLSEVPSAGDNVDAVQDAKKAQQIAEQRRAKVAEKSRGSTTKVSLEELARRMSLADQKDLKVIVKADVQGSVEALNAALEKMSTDKVKVTVVHSGVGAITEGDVNLGVASGALIIGFNTRPAGKARDLAQREGIEIRQYSVIYDVTDDVRASMEGLLAPTLVEEAIGEAEVRRIFKVSKAGVVAGCMVTHGVVRRNSMVRLRRNSSVIWEGKLDSLKRFKDDAKEVREGFDCGISFNGYSDLQEGDVIAAYEVKEVRPTL